MLFTVSELLPRQRQKQQQIQIFLTTLLWFKNCYFWIKFYTFLPFYIFCSIFYIFVYSIYILYIQILKQREKVGPNSPF